jgi:hypothetical protein
MLHTLDKLESYLMFPNALERVTLHFPIITTALIYVIILGPPNKVERLSKEGHLIVAFQFTIIQDVLLLIFSKEGHSFIYNLAVSHNTTAVI